MSNQWIDIRAANGNSFKGYLAVPKQSNGHGIVVCQEIFGVNEYIQQVAHSYAKEGFLVLAPDLFWRIKPGVQLGYTEEDLKMAFQFFGEFDTDKGVSDISQSMEALHSLLEPNSKVGIVGFCLGGRMAYLSAARSRFDAAVAYYGVNIDEYLEEAKNIVTPLLMHFAENDEFAPLEKVERVRKSLKNNPNIHIHLYPGVGHGFARRPSNHYDLESATLANRRSMDLFYQMASIS